MPQKQTNDNTSSQRTYCVHVNSIANRPSNFCHIITIFPLFAYDYLCNLCRIIILVKCKILGAFLVHWRNGMLQNEQNFAAARNLIYRTISMPRTLNQIEKHPVQALGISLWNKRHADWLCIFLPFAFVSLHLRTRLVLVLVQHKTFALFAAIEQNKSNVECAKLEIYFYLSLSRSLCFLLPSIPYNYANLTLLVLFLIRSHKRKGKRSIKRIDYVVRTTFSWAIRVVVVFCFSVHVVSRLVYNVLTRILCHIKGTKIVKLFNFTMHRN